MFVTIEFRKRLKKEKRITFLLHDWMDIDYNHNLRQEIGCSALH